MKIPEGLDNWRLLYRVKRNFRQRKRSWTAEHEKGEDFGLRPATKELSLARKRGRSLSMDSIHHPDPGKDGNVACLCMWVSEFGKRTRKEGMWHQFSVIVAFSEFLNPVDMAKKWFSHLNLLKPSSWFVFSVRVSFLIPLGVLFFPSLEFKKRGEKKNKKKKTAILASASFSTRENIWTAVENTDGL